MAWAAESDPVTDEATWVHRKPGALQQVSCHLHFCWGYSCVGVTLLETMLLFLSLLKQGKRRDHNLRTKPWQTNVCLGETGLPVCKQQSQRWAHHRESAAGRRGSNAPNIAEKSSAKKLCAKSVEWVLRCCLSHCSILVCFTLLMLWSIEFDAFLVSSVV